MEALEIAATDGDDSANWLETPEANPMLHRRESVRRGFSLLDALVVVMVVAVALGMGVIYGLFRDSRVRGCGRPFSCRTRLSQIHKGLTLFANDFNGSYPVPMDLSPETAAITTQSGNSSASLFSFMIFNTYYSPGTVVCLDEVSSNIVAKSDYRYGTQDDPNWNPAWQWDPTFSADITRPGANVSYATLAMIGDRRKNQWRNALDPNFAVAADRGPKDGAWDANSRTLRLHGSAKEWTGNIAFNDGHVQQFTFTGRDRSPFVINGESLFRNDDPDKGADMWLGLFGATSETATTSFWD